MKNLGRTLLFVVGLALLMQGFARVAESLSPRQSDLFLRNDQDTWHELSEKRGEIETLVIGNSHAVAIDLNVLQTNGVRWERASGDLKETAYILEEVVPTLPQLKTVYVPLSYFAFEWETIGQDIMQVRRSHVYATIGLRRPISNDLTFYALGELHRWFPVMTVVREDNWKAVVAQMWARLQPRPQALVKEYDPDCVVHPDLHASATERAESHVNSTQVMTANRPKAKAELYSALVEMIVKLKAQGIDVVLFTPPFSKPYNSYYQHAAPETIRAMHDTVQTIQQRFGVPYYDFSAETSIVDNAELFKDADHLNRCGQRVFTELLKVKLQPTHAQH